MILFNKTATVYWYTKNEYGVSSYAENGTSFKCNVQPIDQADWFDGATVYNTKKLYCEYSEINVGDKIDCYANHEHVITENDIKTLEDNPINFGKIVELKSDVFILTNE